MSARVTTRTYGAASSAKQKRDPFTSLDSPTATSAEGTVVHANVRFLNSIGVAGEVAQACRLSLSMDFAPIRTFTNPLSRLRSMIFPKSPEMCELYAALSDIGLPFRCQLASAPITVDALIWGFLIRDCHGRAMGDVRALLGMIRSRTDENNCQFRTRERLSRY